jgi:endonuclease/exonuclease/phosphatase family metal-dependent hydrolase
MTRASSTLRVLTWNVHGCVGRDRVCDPHRVAEVLAAARPDIAALQEIDARLARSLSLDPFTYFAERFSWASVAARTLATRDGHYGHILMSRWPMESLGDEDLSVPRSEPRRAIFGAVASPFGRITVVAAHLGLLWLDRRKQLARLKARIDALDGAPMLVLGDFNDFRRGGAADRALCPPLRPAPALRTFPSRLPLMRLDRIWYGGLFELEAIATMREAWRLSDHLPVLAELSAAATASVP